jgi:peroxiredoxin Q/BCP
MLTAGRPAPDFTLAADDGSTVSLAALHGKTVVLYFYPKDDTPGCTTEACGIRDIWDDVAATGAMVFGVSADSVRSHAKFRDKYRLPFRLLADEGHHLAEAFGVWGEKKMWGHTYLGILRTTFVIDPNGIITRVFEKVKPADHAAEILQAVKRRT